MKLARLEGAALVLVAVASVWFQVRMPARAVAEADYQAVAQVLEAEAQPGDVVLLHPWWSERARIYVPERIPVVGFQGSDEDRLEFAPRVWVLSQPKMAGAFKTSNAAQGAAREFGNLTLQLYANAKHRAVKWDARAALAQAHVFLEGEDGQRQDCRWDGRAQRCPNGGEVAVEWHEIKFQPRRCFKLYPPGGGAKLVAEFQGVPAAPAIALRAGITWDRGFFHMPELTPVELGVTVNGAAAASLTIPVGTEGVLRAGGPAIPEGATVAVWSRSRNPQYREVCAELYGLEAGDD